MKLQVLLKSRGQIASVSDADEINIVDDAGQTIGHIIIYERGNNLGIVSSEGYLPIRKPSLNDKLIKISMEKK